MIFRDLRDLTDEIHIITTEIEPIIIIVVVVIIIITICF